MKRRLLLALALIVAAIAPAAAQGCGQGNPNCIVPTVPTCVSDNRAASTAYVSSCGSGGPPGGANTDVQFNNSGAFGGDGNFTYSTSGSTVDGINVFASATGNPGQVGIQAIGSDANVSINYNAKGTGLVGFSANGNLAVSITNPASAVNNIQISGAVTTAAPAILALGSDTNVSLSINPKGTGSVLLGSNSTNFVFVAPAATGAAPIIAAAGGDTNITLNLLPKGTGAITMGATGGFSYTDPGQQTLALGTITANAKALNITGTFNASGVTFDAPLFMNIINTASNNTSLLFDFQVGGNSILNLRATSQMFIAAASGGQPRFGLNVQGETFGRFVVQLDGNNNPFMGFGPGGGSNRDIGFGRDSAKNMAVFDPGSTTSATGMFVYNTLDTLGAATNYERGTMDWTTTANTLTIGTQAGGTGTSRNMVITAGTAGTILFHGQSIDEFFLTNGNAQLIVGGVLGWTPSGNVTLGLDTGVSRAVAKVVQFGDGGANANGWINWTGQTRVTADVTFTSTTTLGTVTGLSVNVIAGRTYCFVAELSWTDAAAGGLQLAISGTSTATNIIYDGYIIDSAANGIKGNAQAAALGGVVANAATTGTAGHARISGCDTVNAAGTLLVQAAQSVSNATATTIKRGSYFYVYDSP